MAVIRQLPRKTKYDEKKYETYTFRLNADYRNLARTIDKELKKAERPKGSVYYANEKSIKWMSDEAIKVLRAKRKANRANRFTGRAGGLLEKTIANPAAHSNTREGFRFMVVSKVDKLMGKDNNYAFSIEFGSSYWVGKKLPFSFLGQRDPNLKRGQKSTSRANSERAANDHRTYSRNNSPQEALRTAYRPDSRRSTRRVVNQKYGKSVGVHRFKGVQSNITGDRIVGPRERKGKSSGYLRDAKTFEVTIRRPVPAYKYGQTAAERFLKQQQYEKFLLDGFTRSGFQKMTGVQLVPKGGGQRSQPKRTTKAARTGAGR